MHKAVWKLGIMGDLHAPYHDEGAVDAACRYWSKWGIDALVSVGDLKDYYCLNFHEKSPSSVYRYETVEEEDHAAEDVIKRLESLTDNLWITLGNHDYLVDRYILNKAPELYGSLSVQKYLTNRGWDVTPYRKNLTLGANMNVTHTAGPRGGFSGKNAASQMLDHYGANVMFGHCHRIQTIVRRTIMGSAHVSMVPGWLGDVGAAEYMHQADTRDWCHGAGCALWDRERDSWLVWTVPIVNGECVGVAV